MAKYHQSASGTWHWCRNCSKFPTNAVKTQDSRPSWDLCEECKSKEHNGNCTS
jgi:hypothetical protein